MKTPTRMAMAVAMEALRLLVVQMILLVNIMVRVAQGVPCRSSLCFSSVGLSPCRMARDADCSFEWGVSARSCSSGVSAAAGSNREVA
jgi:hypothetical protein